MAAMADVAFGRLRAAVEASGRWLRHILDDGLSQSFDR
jgi:hypothetical protein